MNMTPTATARNYPLLLASQFLGAFGDNAILAVILGQLTLLQQQGRITGDQMRIYNTIYTVLLFIPFVLLAPLAGYVNDRYSKTTWLRRGNLLKLIGTLVCALSVWFGYTWQGIGYLVVGIGSCVYSPAKYGILPEIVPRSRLVKANGMVELLTLVAILTGAIGGSVIVDKLRVVTCYAILLSVFGVSYVLNLFMSRTPANPEVRLSTSVAEFAQNFRNLVASPRLLRILAGSGLFWVCGAVLKMNFQAWGLQVLLLKDNTQISLLLLWLSVGIMTGSILAGQLYKVGELHATRLYGWLLAAFLGVLFLVEFAPPLQRGHITLPGIGVVIVPVALLLIVTGIISGLFLIPLNAALQAESDHTKLGKTIATQNFVDNLCMIAGGAIVFGSIKSGLNSSQVFLVLAGVVATIVFFLRFQKTSMETDHAADHQPVA
jgi:LPLT family lysophospholipid transporter-like MFS transporter